MVDWSVVAEVALDPANLGWIVFGTVLGILFGVIPGIGSIQGLAILLPLTFTLTPIHALSMLGAVFAASVYAGAITSILVNTPGDPTSAMTVLDGYPMAQQGRAGEAIGAATMASLFGGAIGVLLLMVAAPPIARYAIRLGPPEYFLLLSFGLFLIGVTIKEDVVKGLLSAAIGVLLGTIGMSPTFGVPRFTGGTLTLQDGMSFAVLTVGVFAISEALILIGQRQTILQDGHVSGGLKEGVWSTFRHYPSLLRSTFIGLGIGTLPGIGAVTANIVSYGAEVKNSKTPERFGKGAVEGVIACEASNNATVGASLIPTLTLGIPGSAGAALLIGALTLHGLQPGPRLFTANSNLLWAFFISLLGAQILFFILGLALCNVFAKVTKIPVSVLAPLLIVISVGAAVVDRLNPWDAVIVVIVGIVAYFFRLYGYSTVALIMAFVLSPLVEISIHQTLLMSRGSWMIFIDRPLSRLLIGAFVALLVAKRFAEMRKTRSAHRALTVEQEATNVD